MSYKSISSQVYDSRFQIHSTLDSVCRIAWHLILAILLDVQIIYIHMYRMQ